MIVRGSPGSITLDAAHNASLSIRGSTDPGEWEGFQSGSSQGLSSLQDCKMDGITSIPSVYFLRHKDHLKLDLWDVEAEEMPAKH